MAVNPIFGICALKIESLIIFTGLKLIQKKIALLLDMIR